MIELRNISKSYSGALVLDDVSATLETGAITSFIGPNGAGKTTLLGIASRMIRADGGEVLIDGQDIHGLSPGEFAKTVSILKQSNAINIRLSVRELVSFGRFPYSAGRLTSDDQKIVDEAIRYLDLGSIADKDINNLSGGQRQRAFIAMIVAQDTDHILLDEPLNSLDMKHSVEMMRTVRRLVDELGKTVVLVLHDINFAARYSDHIVALKAGRVAANGAVNDVVKADILTTVFDTPLSIIDHDGKKLSIYY